MRIARTFLPAAGLAALALSACGPSYDPLERDGVWTPVHSNRADLVLMAANPTDLVRGSADGGTDATRAANAVIRLETNKLKKLPEAGTSSVRSGGGGGANNE